LISGKIGVRSWKQPRLGSLHALMRGCHPYRPVRRGFIGGRVCLPNNRDLWDISQAQRGVI
jgi:hypothetical protein